MKPAAAACAAAVFFALTLLASSSPADVNAQVIHDCRVQALQISITRSAVQPDTGEMRTRFKAQFLGYNGQVLSLIYCPDLAAAPVTWGFNPEPIFTGGSTDINGSSLYVDSSSMLVGQLMRIEVTTSQITALGTDVRFISRTASYTWPGLP